MGRGRAPCCDKVGLKKGSWTPAEDTRLVAYIHKHGHGNWRALPKQAGLLRCGKSCRLRWINYLRPDIKRGNFTKEEEETIIELHGLLGNKWSKIAARLPRRTDNEIKNVWNTHLKKRLSVSSPDDKRKEPPGSPPSEPSTSTPNQQSGDGNAETKESLENFDIEISISPDLDVWDALNDCSSSSPPRDANNSWDLQMNKDSSPCSSSSNSGITYGSPSEGLMVEAAAATAAAEPDIMDTSNIFIDDNIQDLDDMLEGGDCCIFSTQIDPTSDQIQFAYEEDHTSIGDHENNGWMEYLEKELDLLGDQTDEEDHSQQPIGPMEGAVEPPSMLDVEIDPISSYFSHDLGN